MWVVDGARAGQNVQALTRLRAGIFPVTPAMSTAAQRSPDYLLQDYVRDIGQVLTRRPALPVIVREVGQFTRQLCADDRWLEERHRVPGANHYSRHLLHRDPQNRFMVLSLVWMPGQATPVHDHSCWGVMGVLDNSLEEVAFERLDDGTRPAFADVQEARSADVGAGSVSFLLPPYQEIHRIGNVSGKPTISVHVYGRDLDEVNVFDQATGRVSPMRIKYSSPECADQPFII
jgi:predicted metal-dependent enzyme (double-stranded beta helix superfamily)